MTKRKTNHSARHGLLALRHGPHHATSSMLNVRHPKKFKLEPLDKKTSVAEKKENCT